MKKTFTAEFMTDNCGCYTVESLAACSFMKKGSTISITDIISSEIPLKDKFWFVFRKCNLALRQKQDLAIGLAEITLVIYEKKCPGDDRPRKAVEGAREYLSGKISREDLLIRRRAYAAADAADAAAAAAAAYAAAYAAAAYAAAAYAAADAAYAAADAAYAAAAAAAALQKFLTDFIDQQPNDEKLG